MFSRYIYAAHGGNVGIDKDYNAVSTVTLYNSPPSPDVMRSKTLSIRNRHFYISRQCSGSTDRGRQIQFRSIAWPAISERRHVGGMELAWTYARSYSTDVCPIYRPVCLNIWTSQRQRATLLFSRRNYCISESESLLSKFLPSGLLLATSLLHWQWCHRWRWPWDSDNNNLNRAEFQVLAFAQHVQYLKTEKRAYDAADFY